MPTWSGRSSSTAPTPALRSFIINWLKPLGVDAGLVVAEFHRVNDSAAEGGLRSRENEADVLFDRDASILRALILALGTYAADELSAGERRALVEEMIELYRSDPDAGIHGAAAWTLRQWKYGDRLGAVDAELARLGDRGEKRWFVNAQGQTFAVIDGPVEFRMGSPADRAGSNRRERGPSPDHHPPPIRDRHEEVTFGQFQRFLKDNDQYNQETQAFLKKFTSAPDGPWISSDWYAAAAYCNWLSKQERLPEDEWCYRPNESGAFAEGMCIPADALDRTGYRLPTEAEWEYACRAGAVTSRHYGLSTEILDRYAWYPANERARPVGTLLPNDLGLFDMLGNVFEWCQDRDGTLLASSRGTYSDRIITTEGVNRQTNRILRGGMFASQCAGGAIGEPRAGRAVTPDDLHRFPRGPDDEAEALRQAGVQLVPQPGTMLDPFAAMANEASFAASGSSVALETPPGGE